MFTVLDSSARRNRGRKHLGRILAATVALILSASSALYAQGNSGRIGLGAGITSGISLSNFEGLLMPTVYVPIMASDRLMIEPGIGILRSSEDDGEVEETSTVLSLGVGLLFLSSASDNDHIYWGPRVSILRTSFSEEGLGIDEEESDTHLRIGGVLGGEFFLRPRFSLGGEVGLNYLSVDAGPGVDQSLLSTSAEFRVRWYFD